jgi:hypothetical protein
MKSIKTKWDIVVRKKGYCNPKVIDVPGKNEFYMYTQSCDFKTARI